MKKTKTPPKKLDPHITPEGKKTVWCAIIYRHIVLPVLVIIAMIFRSQTLLIMGSGFMAFAVYTFIGFKCRWTHLYCAFQGMQKETMTPDNVNWSTILLSTVFKMPTAFGILGLMMVIYQLFYM